MVTGRGHIPVVAHKSGVPDIRSPGVVDEHLMVFAQLNVSDHNHHMSAAARPMPAECEGTLVTVNFLFNLVPGKRRIGSPGAVKAVFVEFGPAAINAGAGSRCI